MKIKHPDTSTGYDYLIAVDRTEWVALKVAVEICMEDFQQANRQGKLTGENQRGLLALYTVMHATMEANHRACPDLPIQDETVQASGGGGTARVQPVQGGKWRGFSLRSSNRKDQDND